MFFEGALSMNRIEKLLAHMSLVEKLGQLTMTAAGHAVTGPVIAGDSTEAIRQGAIGNLLNLMGIPLILGTGVDYSIFMQLALRRYHGDMRMAHRAVGRALMLCGGTAVAGFGALTFSSNSGMASLGKVCAVGIASNMLISVFLLPSWWSALIKSKTKN